MIVLRLESVPLALRGDLTKWLLEIDSGVFVGNVSARVRDNLWERIVKNVKNGRAIMAYSTNSEQGLNFKVHNLIWEPIDFDGMKLILRPSPSRLKTKNLGYKPGQSRQAGLRKARYIRQNTNETAFSDKSRIPAPTAQSIPTEYAIIDVETTGLNNDRDEIIEFGAIKVRGGEIVDTLELLVKPAAPIPADIEKLTGIAQAKIDENGLSLETALTQFLDFIGGLPCVAHNAQFDYGFIRAACVKCGKRIFANKQYDTLLLAKRLLPELKDRKLMSLTKYFGLAQTEFHRSIEDCTATKQIFERLWALREERVDSSEE
jgi:CRISPR-associated protein Cas2